MLKKILWAIGLVLLVGVGGVVFLMIQSSTPLTKQEAQDHLVKYFEKIASKSGNENFSGVQVRVLSKGTGLDYTFGSGRGKRIESLTEYTPYHVASVGKMMTAVLIYQLIDEGRLSTDQPISDLLPEPMLENLFVFEGTDYKDQVTIEQLLAHTSGVADYFGGPVKTGDTMAKLLKDSPDHMWQPDDLIAFSRERQTAVNRPGAGYYYSDTGYILLGKIVEKVAGNSFENVLEERLFKPLSMQDTYMALRQKPLNASILPIADLWLDGDEMGGNNSLSVDWAGGGLISTLADLLKFSQALHSNELISEPSYKTMFSDSHVFEQGIYTGSGGMTIHFEKFFPLLKLPKIKGHIGVLSTHVFYDITTDTHIIMNFGSTDKMVDSFKALIEIMNTLGRIE